MSRIPGSLLAVSLLVTVATEAAAQSTPAGLRGRMDAFAAALRDEARVATIADFFPRDAAWELVRVPDRPTPRPAVETIRILADSTLAAISKGGRVCDSFTGTVGDVGPVETTLGMQTRMHRGAWRYAGRLRFVPPGEPVSSPTYVEWRRERGAWVVSRVGEEYYYDPPVLGQEKPDPTLDTTAGNDLPLERRLAANQQWYRDHEPIVIHGRRYTKYGLPRPLDEGLLRRYGSRGVVPVFVERAVEGDRAEVMYVLVAPGEYQPYQGIAYGGCRAQ